MDKSKNQDGYEFTSGHIKFVKDIQKLTYNPEHKIDTYYQICKFKNPKTNLHQTRKIFFNQKGKILKSYEREYDSKTIKKFLKDTPMHKYKLYPTNLISYIAEPNKSDMTQVQSSLINDKAPKHKWLDNGWNGDEIMGAPFSPQRTQRTQRDC